MISIVTAYYNRKALFIRTLESLVWFGGPEFEVVVVDDGSRAEERLEDLVERFPFLRIHRLEPEQKWYANPCIPFNYAIRQAKGDIIVLQNPECFHAGPVLQHVQNHLKTGVYLSYACYALSDADTKALRGGAEEVQAQAAGVTLEDFVPKVVAGPGWYNHSRVNPRGLHFCCAISREDMLRLGGFDERYAAGICYDDDELLHRIRMAGLEVRFVDEPHVFHQNHYGTPGSGIPCARMRRNEKVFRHLTEPSACFDVNGAQWGDPHSPHAKAANEAVDAMLLAASNIHERLDEGERWKKHAAELEESLHASASEVEERLNVSAGEREMLHETVRGVLHLAHQLKHSLVTRWAWRSRHQRELNRTIKWMKMAKASESRGEYERAAELRIKSLKTSAEVLSEVTRKIWWSPSWRKVWVGAWEPQVKAVETWWHTVLERKKAAGEQRSG